MTTPQPSQLPPPAYVSQPPQGLAIASLITGIAAIVFAFAYIGLGAGIAAVITGNLAKKNQPYARSLWFPGLITGWIGIGLSVLWIIASIVLLILYVAFFAFAIAHDGDGSFSQY